MMATTQGSGSIIQLDKGADGKKARSKCRKWRLVVSLGRDPHARETRYRQKARNFQGTYTEAQRELRKFIEELEGGDVVPRKTWTFNQYAEHFVKTREASGQFAERTIAQYGSNLRSLGRLIGGLKLQQITPEVLEDAYASLRSGTNGIERAIGKRTLFNINRSAYIMFMDAHKKGIIAANPLDQVAKPKKESKPKRALPGDKYRKLLADLDPTDRNECAVYLCASLGLRRSEAVAISWGDVSFAEETVNIHSSLDDHGNLKEPKTEAGYRLLPLAQTVADALMRRKAVQVAQFLKREPRYVIEIDPEDAPKLAGLVEIGGRHYDLSPKAPLVCDEFGKRPLPHTFSVWWTRHRKDYGLDDWTLHELRHSFLAAAAAEGIHPAVMQQLAGHKSAETTMEIYTHVNMTSKRNAVETLQAAYM